MRLPAPLTPARVPNRGDLGPMQPMPVAEAHRRAVRVALGLGVVMLASGAQTREVETSLRVVLQALGLPGAGAVVT
jgi:uncharacterized membrane protein YjjP (DUF1212 family)